MITYCVNEQVNIKGGRGAKTILGHILQGPWSCSDTGSVSRDLHWLQERLKTIIATLDDKLKNLSWLTVCPRKANHQTEKPANCWVLFLLTCYLCNDFSWLASFSFTKWLKTPIIIICEVFQFILLCEQLYKSKSYSICNHIRQREGASW